MPQALAEGLGELADIKELREYAGRVYTWRVFSRLVICFAIHAIIDVTGVMFLLTGSIATGILCIATGTTILLSSWLIVPVMTEPTGALPAGDLRIKKYLSTH